MQQNVACTAAAAVRTIHCRELEYHYSPIIGNLEYRWTQIKAFSFIVFSKNDFLVDYCFYKEISMQKTLNGTVYSFLP